MSDEKKGVSPLATGVAGAVIGAAAAAAAIALADEKNRKKAKQILADMQKEGDKIFKEITKKAMELKDVVSKTSAQNEKSPKRLQAKKR